MIDTGKTLPFQSQEWEKNGERLNPSKTEKSQEKH